MRKWTALGAALTVAALSAPARGDHTPGCRTSCYTERTEARCVSKPAFRLEVTEEKYTVTVPVAPKLFDVKTTTGTKDVPCTRMVPVCVTDPCTGWKRTEYQPETVVRNLKTTVVDITPLPQPCEPQTRAEERTRRCFHVTISHVPVTETYKLFLDAKGRPAKSIRLPCSCGDQRP